MTALNPFSVKERNNYLLELEGSSTALKQVKKRRFKGGFSRTKRVITASLLGMVAATTLLGGLALNTSPDTKQSAQAGLIEPTDWVCTTKDDDKAYLGGTNGIIDDGWTDGKGTAPYKGLLKVGKGKTDKDGNATERWTALEQYGYFAPSYSTWTGRYVSSDDDKAAFVGTGGRGNNSYGTPMAIKDPNKSPLFSHSVGDCLNVGNNIVAGTANAITFLPKVSIAISGELYQYASGVTLQDGPLEGLSKAIETMIVGDGHSKGLKDILFLDFLTPIIIIGAIGFFWTGIIKRSSIQAGQSAIWMIGAAIGGLIFLTNPLMVPNAIDKIAGDFNGAVQKALLAGGNTSSMCQLDSGAKDAPARTVKCAVWYSTIYAPWVTGQFGENQYGLPKNMTTDPAIKGDGTVLDDPKGNLDGKGFDKAKDGTFASLSGSGNEKSRGVFANANIKFGNYTVPSSNVNWALYQMNTESNWKVNTGLNYSEIAYNRLVANDNTQWVTLDGAVPAAFLSFIGAIGPVVVMLSISFMILAYQVTMLVLIAFSPIFFLVGVAPGWGRRIAMRWLEIVVGILAKRIILTFFLMLYIKMYMVIVSQTTIEWFFQMVLIGVLSYVASTQRGTLMNAFTNAISFGGDKSMNMDGGVGRFGENAVEMAQRRGARYVGANAKNASAKSRAFAKDKVGGAVGAAKQGVVDANGRRKDNKVVKKQDRKDTKFEQKRGAKVDNILGVGDSKNVAALDNLQSVTQIDQSRLTQKELGKILDDSGNVNKKQAEKWFKNRKADYIAQSRSIGAEMDQVKKDAEGIKKNKDLTKKQKANELRKLGEHRESIRNKQVELNREVKRVFGDANPTNTPDYTGGLKTGKAQALTTQFTDKNQLMKDYDKLEKQRAQANPAPKQGRIPNTGPGAQPKTPPRGPSGSGSPSSGGAKPSAPSSSPSTPPPSNGGSKPSAPAQGGGGGAKPSTPPRSNGSSQPSSKVPNKPMPKNPPLPKQPKLK